MQVTGKGGHRGPGLRGGQSEGWELVDADPQRSASMWLADQEAVEVVAHAGGDLEGLLPRVAGRFAAVVVDLPPGVPGVIRSALRAAAVLLVPVQPSPVDVVAAEVTLALLPPGSDGPYQSNPPTIEESHRFSQAQGFYRSLQPPGSEEARRPGYHQGA